MLVHVRRRAKREGVRIEEVHETRVARRRLGDESDHPSQDRLQVRAAPDGLDELVEVGPVILDAGDGGEAGSPRSPRGRLRSGRRSLVV